MSDPIVVCNLCYPDAEEIAVFNDDYALMFWEGKYHLIGQPGHSDYITYTFKDDPFADPDPESNREDLTPEEEAKVEKWLDQLQEFEETLKVSPLEGVAIVDAIRAAGYTEGRDFHCYMMTWFYNHLGELVDKHKGI